MTRSIDHLVYAVPDLENALDWFEKNAGIRPSIGGRHLNQGTKNAILNLGNNCYLEILAVDKANKEITRPRWMGIDSVTSPKMTRWSLRSNNLIKDSKVLKIHNAQMGERDGGQRQLATGQLLTWEMILPLANPEVELVPFMTHWPNMDLHPSVQLSAQCQFVRLEFFHPQPAIMETIFEQLQFSHKVQLGSQAIIYLHLNTPMGRLRI